MRTTDTVLAALVLVVVSLLAFGLVKRLRRRENWKFDVPGIPLTDEKHRSNIQNLCSSGMTWTEIMSDDKWKYLSKYNGDEAWKVCKEAKDKTMANLNKGGTVECKHGRCPNAVLRASGRPCLNQPGKRPTNPLGIRKCCDAQQKFCKPVETGRASEKEIMDKARKIWAEGSVVKGIKGVEPVETSALASTSAPVQSSGQGAQQSGACLSYHPRTQECLNYVGDWAKEDTPPPRDPTKPSPIESKNRGAKVILYESETGTGNTWYLDKDKPNGGRRSSLGWSDSVRSVYVPPGQKVTLYEKDNYGGKAVCLHGGSTGTTHTLKGDTINGNATSIKIGTCENHE